MKKNVSPPPAFTLIELLAALAIVATLAALVLGTVETIRERASKVQCMANMRALYSGFSLYAADNKQAVARQSLPSSARHWHRNIWPYLDPSGTWENWGDAYAAASQGKPGWAYSCPSMIFPIRYVSYGFNQNLTDKKFLVQSRVILLAETQGTAAAPEPPQILTGSAANLAAGRIGTRHGNKANLLFLDGHLETRALADIPDSSEEPGFWGRE
jgi:general secretion pathway protein G